MSTGGVEQFFGKGSPQVADADPVYVRIKALEKVVLDQKKTIEDMAKVLEKAHGMAKATYTSYTYSPDKGESTITDLVVGFIDVYWFLRGTLRKMGKRADCVGRGCGDCPSCYGETDVTPVPDHYWGDTSSSSESTPSEDVSDDEE